MSSHPLQTEWIWKDGAFLPWQSAQIHVMSHVVHYGSSVFEGLRCYETPTGSAIFRAEDHFRRLIKSASIYRMPVEYSVEELTQASQELFRRNNLRAGYLRPIVIRGFGALGVNPAPCPVEVYLMCWPWGAYLGAEGLERGVDVCVSTWARPAPNTYPALAKAGGNYLNGQLVKMEAVANGYAEAIALGTDGLVSEGSGQNLFLVEGGTLVTPRMDGTMLGGITRDTVIHLALDLGIEVREESVPREALYTADELFFTGTAAEVTPIRSVDRIDVGEGAPGPVTRKIQQAYLDLVEGRRADTRGWRSEFTLQTTAGVA